MRGSLALPIYTAIHQFQLTDDRLSVTIHAFPLLFGFPDYYAVVTQVANSFIVPKTIDIFFTSPRFYNKSHDSAKNCAFIIH